MYWVGLDSKTWSSAAWEACQPRGADELRADFVDRLDEPTFAGLITSRPILLATLDELRGGRPRQIIDATVPAGADAVLTTCAAATFGTFDPRLSLETLPREVREVASASDFALLWAEKQAKRALCWHDIVNRHLSGSASIIPPTVIVCDTMADVAALWNLRCQALHHGTRVIPLPAAAVDDPQALTATADLIRASAIGSDNCRVVWSGADVKRVNRLRGRLGRRLAGSGIRHVDAQRTVEQVPVMPECKRIAVPVEVDGNAIAWMPPRPPFADYLVRDEAWSVDLAEDVETGRAPLELELPVRGVCATVLNAPSPPRLTLHRLARLGAGPSGIHVRCGRDDRRVRLTLPSDEELIEELLRDGGFEPEPDEKRRVYQPVLSRFGSLQQAAAMFAGQRRGILSVLEGGPATLSEIQGRAKLGKGKLDVADWWGRYDEFINHEPEALRRVARKRAVAYLSGDAEAATNLADLLDVWRTRGLVNRVWRLPKCRSCGQGSWIDTIDLTTSTPCPLCGTTVALPASVELGYQLDRALAHALKEGLLPVALAGNFLRRSTRRAFRWLPGVKGVHEGSATDVDVAALCDGRLVLGECKNLGGSESTLSGLLEQVERLAAVGRTARADMLLLASLRDSYPKKFLRDVDRLAAGILVLALGKTDLESGERRTISPQGAEHVFRLSDVFSTEPPRRRRRRPRRTSF